MLVVICGMYRSGSTLVAQLVKGLLETQSKPVTISSNGLGSTAEEMHARAADANQIWIAKVHRRAKRYGDSLPDNGAIYFYTYRDMRDAVASAWRKNRLQIGDSDRSSKALESFIKDQIKAGKTFEACKNLWIGQYEDFIHSLEDLVTQLAETLKINASPQLIKKLVSAARPSEQLKRVNELKRGNNAVRASTFITSNHITDGREGAWKETLTVAEAQLAETLARDWLKAKGYELYFQQAENSTTKPVNYQVRPNPASSKAEKKGPQRWWPFSARR
jgi:hypothetical protein